MISEVRIAATTDQNSDLLNNSARRLRRGKSALRNDLEESAFAMPAINCDLSITRLILETNTEMNAATAPRRNAGAATLAMMRPSYSTEGVIRRRSFATSMFSTNDLVDPCELYGSRSTFAAMSGARLTR